LYCTHKWRIIQPYDARERTEFPDVDKEQKPEA